MSIAYVELAALRPATVMSKRDLAFLSATADNNLEPRSKRRRDTKSEEQDVTITDAISTAEDEGEVVSAAPVQSKEEVREQGLKLWHLVKDAVNKECVRGNCSLHLCQPCSSNL